ncbi:MAG TPA: amino acid permease [Kofleriaceae bacterium]|nr:amino acid permease [Kofleriaceae bacterium]
MTGRGDDDRRHIGLMSATLVGIGGILGGGMLVLAGTAFAQAGPSFILAFALNGAVAFLTAMSVAEMSTAFPQSGGAYTFAKKVLSVRTAFSVGWVLWFAYIVAGVLYALSFASFTSILLRGAVSALGGEPPAWLGSRRFVLLLATLGIAYYSAQLARRSGGGSKWSNIGKIILFGFLIAAGVVAIARQPVDSTLTTLDPFFSGGFGGLVAAMGLTFIAIQGFEMIAAVAGEIRDPQRVVPRAMKLSLVISLAVYIPLIAVIAIAGVEPGGHITALAASDPDTVTAVAAHRFLGETGYWIVVGSIALATLSAIQANLLTASRVAHAMAADHTLPEVLERQHPVSGTPIMAIYASALTSVAILFMIPDLASAGAAASLIFLMAFALTHLAAYLARRREKGPIDEGIYRSPVFPLVPLVGGVACAGLGIYQAVAVPDAGAVMLMWLGLGVILYFALFKSRAETADASAEALDPRLARLRGKSPLVLLPIANPKNARSLVEVANALAPTEFARVLLLAIVRGERGGEDPAARLADAQDAVRQALEASYSAGHAPEALITAAARPWAEIRRVAEEHRCESMLIGLGEESQGALDRELEDLINDVDCDVAVMRAPVDWRVGSAARVLVPVGGRGEEHGLRARLLGTLCRELPREIRFLTVLPTSATDDEVADAVRAVSRVADLNIPVEPIIEVVRSDDPAQAILEEAARSDLLVLGLRQSSSGRKVFGKVTLRIARGAPCAVILLARRAAAMSELYRPLRGAVIPWRGRAGTQAE